MVITSQYLYKDLNVFDGSMELIGVYRVLAKMRVTIPKEIAERWSLNPRDKLVIYYDSENDRLVIEKWEKWKR